MIMAIVIIPVVAVFIIFISVASCPFIEQVQCLRRVYVTYYKIKKIYRSFFRHEIGVRFWSDYGRNTVSVFRWVCGNGRLFNAEFFNLSEQCASAYSQDF